jgi:ABC-type Fe3+/spermidine/putrescine transport system ATPase subunit
LFVTHDQLESFAIGDVIGVMHEGRLHQWDDAYTPVPPASHALCRRLHRARRIRARHSARSQQPGAGADPAG